MVCQLCLFLHVHSFNLLTSKIFFCCNEEDSSDEEDSCGEEGISEEEDMDTDIEEEEMDADIEEEGLEELAEKSYNKCSDFKLYVGMKIKKRFGDKIFVGRIKSGPRSVKDKSDGKMVSAWIILYDDDDVEDMNLEEVFTYHCEEESSDHDHKSSDDNDGKSLCHAFFDDGDLGLMSYEQLKKEHEKLGIPCDGRWGTKKLVKNLEQHREEMKLKD